MDLIQIYQCFCDRTRLRILNLLARGPLCVCHLQEILNEPQVRVSKHLAYLRARKMVVTQRQQNWIIYSLPEKFDPELDSNLRCLQDCTQSDPAFKRDLQNFRTLQDRGCQPREVLTIGESFVKTTRAVRKPKTMI